MPGPTRPNEEIQKTIRLAINFHKEDVGKKAMINLDEMARIKLDALVPQIIYFYLHVDNEKEGLGILGIMKNLEHRGHEIRQGLIPLLEISNEKIYETVCIWLGNIDGYYSPKPEEKLPHYRKMFQIRKEAPPSGLVKYVFGLSSSKALLFFGETYAEKFTPGEFPRNLMWADHVIQTVKWRMRNHFLKEDDLEKAQKELDWLSKHEGWYARRYVVEIIRDSPKLGTPDLVNRLMNDPNPLVSEAAKGIK